MRKKLKSASGLTLVELLCAAVILMLLGLLVNVGIQVAVSSCRDLTAEAESQLLLSTAAATLTDELRYARDVSTDAPGGVTSYRSASFGPGTCLAVDANGRIVAESGGQVKQLLPPGAYGLNGAYRAVDLEITAGKDGDKQLTFTLQLKIETADQKTSAKMPSGGMAVRCLNPVKEEEGGTPP